MEDLVTSVEGHTAFIKINRPPNNHFDSELISVFFPVLDLSCPSPLRGWSCALLLPIGIAYLVSTPQS